MSAQTGHLRLIEGEVIACPECQHKDDTIAGLNRKMNGMAAEITALRRDRAREAKEHPLWDELEALYGVWRVECKHPRSTFTTDDFWLAVGHYEHHGWDLCERAIAGAKFDCYRSRRRNQSWKRHDDWTLIFRDRGKFEEFCNRAPREFEAKGLPERFRTKREAATA